MSHDQSDLDPTEKNRLSSEKIREVQKALQDQYSSAKSSLNNSCGEDEGQKLNSSSLASALFQRAPVDFLERKTLEDLVEITQGASNCLDRFYAEEVPIRVEVENKGQYCCLFVAIGDRPFVISSMSECLRDFGVTIFCLIHPILLDRAFRTSFSYIEISPLPAQQLELLRNRVMETLSHVRAATDDFTAMLVRAETSARILGNSRYPSPFPSNERKEISSFLRWLTDGGLIFLGYTEWTVKSDELDGETPHVGSLGILKLEDPITKIVWSEIKRDVKTLISSNEANLVTRLSTRSSVHRRVRMSHFCIVEYNTQGVLEKVHSFLGLLTSKAIAQESSSIPLIRQKLQVLLQLEGVIENSYNYKDIVDTVDSMPKDEALQMDLDDLRSTVHTVIGIRNRNETRVSVRFDSSHRSVSVLVAMPRDRFNTQVRNTLQRFVEKSFLAAPDSSEYSLDLSTKPHARLYFNVPVRGEAAIPIDIVRFKSDIADLTRTWRDNLRERITESTSFEDASSIWYRYSDAFPEDYQASISVADCELDITQIERLSSSHPIVISMSSADYPDPAVFTLLVFHLGSEITVSRALPILENAGLEIINERSFRIDVRGQEDSVYVHRFFARSVESRHLRSEVFPKIIAPGLEAVFLAEADNDRLNSLMVSSAMSVRQISLLRCYCSLLWQMVNFASRGAILQSLSSQPEMASRLWSLFEIRFDPASARTLEERNELFSSGLSEFRQAIRDIQDITQDRVLRSLATLLENTVRTNFFANTSAIALKIHSENADIVPQPRPMFETYVRSPEMEGVHLRGRKIARGGLRWSDRHQDFRTEIQGLVKTQRIKNAVIVPAGAKGGFVVKNLPSDPKEIPYRVQGAYKTFIRSLLSISDNRVKDQVVHPDKVLCYDGEDPYLVVAADKGTATFSDLANEIATKEFDFWLGDAFASGGSQGYDHKLYGITARGAWESVKRHFKNCGINHEDEPFTAIGIGDMSGDVFGNGLLLSDNVKLIASFNHKHIFVDPTPDPKASFLERKRLFELPGSQWTDYAKELLSEGGAIYGRFDKEIRLSPEARSALSLPESAPETMNGESLISWILRADVALLWNGGIGTYVKSMSESHVDVGDGTNDTVRINANELRASVVGEGGNLGFTQLARIEFSMNGGHIFTDAIDNSGGVDLSDHEVNLKILFEGLMAEGKMTILERNDLLRRIAPEVVEMVLTNNINQAKLLTIGRNRSIVNIDYFRSLIRFYVDHKYLDRAVEHLPPDEELADRADRGEGLCAPELAVCLAATKMWIADALLDSELVKDPMLQDFLLQYFPSEVRERFEREIFDHPLARNIIATQVTNTLVNAVGITFIHRMCINHSTDPIMVIKCSLAAEMLIGAEEIRASLSGLDTFKDHETCLQLTEDLNAAVRDATFWLISCHGHDLTLAEMVDMYRQPFDALCAKANELLVGDLQSILIHRFEMHRRIGLSSETSKLFASFPRVNSFLEIIWASHRSSKPLETVARAFSVVLETLSVNLVYSMESFITPRNKWESELLMNSLEDIRRGVSKITRLLLEANIEENSAIENCLVNSASFAQLRSLISEAKEKQASVAAFSVIARQLRMFRPQLKLPPR